VALVDPVFAQWLQEDALKSVTTDAALAARWGDGAITTERLVPHALLGEAQTEAARQLAFLGGPLVEEQHTVSGEMRGYLGQVINLTIAQLGYDAGVDVFVIGVQDNLQAGVSTINVLRRL
jgi:hypothetical protein